MSPALPLTIGFTRHFSSEIPYWAIVEHSARERAHELGASLIVRHNLTGLEQAAVIHDFIQQRVSGIIIAPVYPTHPALADALEQAARAGIPVVAVDTAPIGPVTCVVQSNDVEGIGAAATFLADRLNGRGKVIHLQGNLLYPVAQRRSAGVRQILERFPELEIVAETDRGNWLRPLTRPLMREILAAHPDIHGVIAANDPMALGALDALQDVGRLGEVVVAGVDGDPHALLALEVGTLAATVGRSPTRMGHVGVEMVLAAIEGSPIPPEINLRDMTLVTAATVSQTTKEALSLLPGVIDGLMESSAELDAERTMLRTIIDTLPDTIYVKDRDGRFEVANQAIARLMGVDHPAELIGKTDFEFYPPELAAQYHRDEQAIIHSGIPLLNKDEQVVDPHGNVHWVVTTKVPLRDHQGRIVRLVGRGQDITARRQAEEERRALEHKLLETQKLESLGVLAGGIAHDFNNLLVAILGNAGLALLDLPSEAPAREAIEQIEIAARRAADLTRQMLAYAGKGRFVVQPINLNAIVEEMLYLLHASIPKHVALCYDPAPDLPLVEADATQLRQIVMNLVVNAAESIEAEQGAISITTGVRWADVAYLADAYQTSNLAEGTYVFVEVTDTGCGMDQATRAKIFDPFFTTKFTGRGLGLAAVLGIVRGHHGTLRVDSEVGRGSTFTILLPKSASIEDRCTASTSAEREWQGAGTVLVIDDEPNVRSITARLLRRLGFTALTADDGCSGVELFQTHADDIVCVLLDLTMPQLDGQETLRLIRRMRPNARVVLMSGYSEQEAISRFAGQGIVGFLPKPFTLNDLRARLQPLCTPAEEGVR